MVKHGNKTGKDYSAGYAKAYHTALSGMVERRMCAAISEIGSFWYSAWVDAGQPDLDKLIAKPLSSKEKKKIQHEVVLYRSGKVLALTH